MCGIAGFLGWGAMNNEQLAAVARAMTDTLVHRGPDDVGVWTDAASGIALGHRRLAIVDLSPEGRQPMMSADGRWVIAFNGEIYNFHELRNEIDGATARPTWRGHSDTEVFLAACVHFGVDEALRRAVGMFAMVLWDREERVLRLVRDRMGEKPLYYGVIGAGVAFASELKALAALPGWRGEIDREALAEFMQVSVIPAPRSIYQGVNKLPAGTVIQLGRSELSARSVPQPKPYWSLAQVIERVRAEPPIQDEAEAVGTLDAALRRTIRDQMIADVPLGAFLSGGIDSSTVVALMQAQSSRPVRTFTIGFEEREYNEADQALEVARHLGTDHTELYVSPADARGTIPRLATVYDEPFADSSQIPTLLVCALARQHVTVSLSGDGGDELFGGYNRYFWANSLLRRFGSWPEAARRGLGRALAGIPPALWDGVVGACGPFLPRRLRMTQPGDKAHKYAALLQAGDESSLYSRLVSTWPAPDLVTGVHREIGTTRPPSVLSEVSERMMFRDSVGYLADDILVKVDRAAMSVSLETRVPFLDHRVVELAWRMALPLKIRDGRGKHVLRQVLDRYVPSHLIDRPKQGFGVPLDQWLRGPLREWAADLLDPARIRSDGILDPHALQTAWDEHQSGRRNWQHRLWNALMFQSWYAANRPS